MALFCCSLGSLFSQTSVTLEKAISSSAYEIGGILDSGTSIAVVNFNSASSEMSDYILGEINNVLANQKNLIVVGRGRDLELARQELNLNLSGDVSDESAQSIGRFLGAQMVVYGSLRIAGENYRFMVQAMEVETGVIRYSQTQNILNDRQVKTLMGHKAIVLDFTPAERVGTAALNLALGMGSFIVQKDISGGSKIAVLEGVGISAIAISRFLVREKDVIDKWTGFWYTVTDTSLSTPVLIAGLGAYAAGAVYGIIRASIYHKPGINITETYYFPWNIALVSDHQGNATVRLDYTIRF